MMICILLFFPDSYMKSLSLYTQYLNFMEIYGYLYYGQYIDPQNFIFLY